MNERTAREGGSPKHNRDAETLAIVTVGRLHSKWACVGCGATDTDLRSIVFRATLAGAVRCDDPVECCRRQLRNKAAA